MVGFLLRYHLHALHIVSQGSEEGLFLDGNFAYGFGNAAGAHHIDKVAVIHPAYVNIRFHRRFQHVDGSLGRAGNVESPGQVVYRAEGDKAEGGAAVDRHHAIDDFVNGTVAAHAYHIPPCFCCISGKIRGIPCFSVSLMMISSNRLERTEWRRGIYRGARSWPDVGLTMMVHCPSFFMTLTLRAMETGVS